MTFNRNQGPDSENLEQSEESKQENMKETKQKRSGRQKSHILEYTLKTVETYRDEHKNPTTKGKARTQLERLKERLKKEKRLLTLFQISKIIGKAKYK